MKVNVRGIWYDAEVEPIAIELNYSDRENIKNMLPHYKQYICYPEGTDFKKVANFLKLEIRKKPTKSRLMNQNLLILEQFKAMHELNSLINKNAKRFNIRTEKCKESHIYNLTFPTQGEQLTQKALKKIYKDMQRGLNYLLNIADFTKYPKSVFIVDNHNFNIYQYLDKNREFILKHYAMGKDLCYKYNNKVCEYNCIGQCKESC